MTDHSDPTPSPTKERNDSNRSVDESRQSDEGSDKSPEDSLLPDETEQEPSDSEDDAAGDPRRPAFLDDLPDNAELRPLVAAFVDGDYARLRRLEQALSGQTTDPDILSAARELVERTEPDPLSKKLLWLAVLFFLSIVGWVYLHHAP